MSNLKRFFSDESGVAATEFIILTIVMAVAGAAVLTAFSQYLTLLMNDSKTTMAVFPASF